MLGRGLEALIPPQENKEEKAPEITASPVASSVSLPVAPPSPQKDKPQETPDIFRVENSTETKPRNSENEIDFNQDEKNEEQKSVNKHLSETDNDVFEKKNSTHTQQRESIFLIEIEKIKPNPLQPRRSFNEESIKELAASIQEFGILQPLLVSKIEEETENGTRVSYQLIAGERRFKAAKMLGLEQVPVIVKKIDIEADRLEMAITENLQRADLNPVETARAFAKLQDEFGLTQREIAQRLGKSREAVANTLRLLNLPSNIQDALTQNKINESQARALLAVSDLNQQQALFQELIDNNLSVRDLKEKIKTGDISGQPADPENNYLENQLEEVLGTRVQISKNQNKGKIIIKFFSPEELDTIIKKICKENLN
ncbi:MAG: ParB/RepB/Spo0J family partition protein [Patescibacteria group bacterium]